MEKFHELLRKNPIGVLEGRFRSRLTFEEIKEFDRDETGLVFEITFEKDDEILGIMKPSETTSVGESCERANGFYGEELILMCSFESKEKNGDSFEIVLRFSTSLWTGTFVAVIDGYNKAVKK